MILDEYKIRVLRGLASWILSGLGMWIMAGAFFFAALGPRLLNLAMLFASGFVAGYLLLRAGLSLK